MTKKIRTITRLSAAVLAAVVAAGCEATKSETPTSPNVAGPIAGIGITAPGVKSPTHGNNISNTEPLRLTWEQSTTNGVRSLWYSVEMAVDREFAQRVYFNPKVLPSEGQQMSLVVDAKLDADRTYYWRVRAEDGANSSEYSSVAHFDLVVPVFLGAPTPYGPTGGETLTTRSVRLTVDNGSVQGRPGDIEIVFLVSTNEPFTNIVWTVRTLRSETGRTALTTPELAASTIFYWRAYATSGATTSAPSATQSFRTGAAAAPGPGGGGGGGGGLPPAPGGNFRTPDPAAGQRLPLPGYGASVVQQIASQFPNALRNSCQDDGGTWEFLDRVVDALRQYDTRWGYNGKRGNGNDPSKDVVDYHYGRGTSENSTDVYIIDVIGGHCGGNPSAGWGDVTDVTINSGTIGRWIGRGRF
ncbi:MAG: hypothetical protein H0W08_08970 [Acidobacteria bacterium]|nr:hypothetical protein [Acidobacteriota bacterium]